ncbi:MAG: amidohydrolase family protein [Acidobacteriota bacterium]|nr:amidohydrolase family protein [Acidobacteriota bacterium]
MTILYCAKWVLPIASAVIDDGAVAVEDARIVAVGARGHLTARFPEAGRREFGEAAILPGLVNAHSHLELTALRNYLEPEEGHFFAWLRKLTVARLERLTADDLYVSAAWGAVEAARAGVTSLGDASDSGRTSLAALSDVGLRGTIYQEVFGPDARLAGEQIEKLRDKVDELRARENGRVRVGISPHAPYTVSAALLERVTDYALAEGLPVMMHAAESASETEFMREGRGVFAESLNRRGIEWGAPGISTIQYLAARGVLDARPLLAHCVAVDEADIATMKEKGVRVAHCPKSNAKFGHGRAPFESFLRHELTIGFGSDSVASNNTCDILEEARFATLLSRASIGAASGGRIVDADAALRTATLGGALSLGLETQTGMLAEGMQADLTIVSLDGAHQLPIYDPTVALVFASSGRDVVLTMVAGREVFSNGRVTTIDEERLRARMKEIERKLKQNT